jgi:hypothetical protein
MAAIYLFRRKAEPATDIGFAAVADTGHVDTEKQCMAELEGGARRREHQVDPALEARVIRKMDLQLVSLVTILCRQPQTHGEPSNTA